MVPGFINGKVALVLDVDSDKPDDFSQADADGLAAVMKIIERVIAVL